MTSLADEVHDRPVLLSLLEILGSKRHSFVSSQAAGQHESEQGSIAFSSDQVCIRCLPQRTGLLCGEPVAQPDTVLLQAFHPPDSGGEIRTEQTAISGLERQPANRTKTEIDRSRSQSPRFQMAPVSEYYEPIEGQPGF